MTPGFWKASAGTGAVLVFGMVAAALRTKAVALAVDAAAFGLYGVFLSVQNFVAYVPLLGMGSSVVRAIAIRSAAADPSGVRSLALAALAATLITSAAAAGILILLSDEVAGRLLASPGLGALVVLLALSVPFAVSGNLGLTILQGVRASRAFIGATAGGFALSLAFVIPGAALFGLSGALVGFVLSTALAGLVSVIVALKHIPPGRPAESPGPSMRRSLIDLAPTSAAAFSLNVLGTANPLLLRLLVLQTLGLTAVGLLHAAAGITTIAFSLIASSLGWYMVPRMSEVSGTPDLLRAAESRAFRSALQLMFPIALLLVVFAGQAVSVLLSPTLAPAAELLPVMVIAEYLNVAAWGLLVSLLPRGRAWQQAAIEGLRTLVLVGATVALTRSFGLTGAALAYGLAAAAVLLAAGWYVSTRLGSPLGGANVRFFLVTLATLLAIALLGRQPLMLPLWVPAAGIAALGLLVASTSHERSTLLLLCRSGLRALERCGRWDHGLGQDGANRK